MVSIEVSMPRATWTSDLPSISLSGDTSHGAHVLDMGYFR